MAETLGSLCDKLTIVKLKQYHSEDSERLSSLKEQEHQLQAEIDDFVSDAVDGLIPLNKLTFKSNKVYKQAGNETSIISGSIGVVFAKLAAINCDLWHEQEKVYEFEKVGSEEKDNVVKRLAILNLERNNCIDLIDNGFKEYLVKAKS
ncbi:MAG: hypothetical protein ACK5NK_14660 [Niabella sp.]